MVRNGSMALLRAVSGSMQKNHQFDITSEDNVYKVQDRDTDYYHLVICAESSFKQQELLHQAMNMQITDSSQNIDPNLDQKIIDITNVNRLIKTHASFFKTHFIKYNENKKKDKILTDEITKMVLSLGKSGFKYIAKNDSEIELKIKNAFEDFDKTRE